MCASVGEPIDGSFSECLQECLWIKWACVGLRVGFCFRELGKLRKSLFAELQDQFAFLLKESINGLCADGCEEFVWIEGWGLLFSGGHALCILLEDGTQGCGQEEVGGFGIFFEESIKGITPKGFADRRALLRGFWAECALDGLCNGGLFEYILGQSSQDIPIFGDELIY